MSAPEGDVHDDGGWDGFAEAAALEAFKLVHGAVELALQRAFVADDSFENLFWQQHGGGAADVVFGVHLFLADGGKFVVVGDLLIEIIQNVFEVMRAEFFGGELFGIGGEPLHAFVQMADDFVGLLGIAFVFGELELGELADFPDGGSEFLQAFDHVFDSGDGFDVVLERAVERVAFGAVAHLPRGLARIPPVAIDVGGDFAGFGHANAAESPDGGNDLADEHFFQRADGLEAFLIFAAELFEIASGFLMQESADDDLAGERAVFYGVPA